MCMKAAKNGDRSENGDYIYGKKKTPAKLTEESIYHEAASYNPSSKEKTD